MIISRALLCALLIVAPSVALALQPNDIRYEDQWYLRQIGAPAAWDITTGSRSVTVAVLDTGVDWDHPDIVDNLWTNPGEVAGNGVDDDGNGYIDDIHGWDFVDDDATSYPDWLEGFEDAASHGTLIAGLIGATGNNIEGMAGVSWEASIMPVRMLNNRGSGVEQAAADAIAYAVANGADVINLSFAGNEAHSALRNAVRDAYAAGVVVVAALGNDARNTETSPVYPACLRSSVEDWVIGVAASDREDRAASFTNFGKTCADLSAPGSSVMGLMFEDRTDGFIDAYGGPWGGTSVASPLVSGAAALLLSKYPALSPEDIRTILKLSVDPVRSEGYRPGQLGTGRLNVARALEVAALYVQPEEDDVSEEDDDSAVPPRVSGRDAGVSYVAFGAPSGARPNVDVRRADGTEYASFGAYAPNFQGGVRVGMLNDDGGVPEIVTGAGPSGGPHVRIFRAYGAVMSEFFAYDPASRQGVDVAVADIDADGESDIVTAVGAGVSQDVVVWSQAGGEKLRFSASGFEASEALRVVAADVDSDWQSEIIVYTADSAVPKVAVYDHTGALITIFSPFASGGISVAAADIDGDYYDDVVVSSLVAGNDVRTFTKIGALRGVFTAEASGASTGWRVASADVDADGDDDIFMVENIDRGRVRVTSSDGQTVHASWEAPSFGSQRGPFFAAW